MKRGALAVALRLLRYRSRTRAELKDKLLERGYSPQETEEALEKLEQHRLLNDKQFAYNYARDRLTIYRRGRFLIGLELLKKGLDKELIDEVLKTISIDEELTAATALLASRSRSWQRLEPLARRHRALALLQRRGFRAEVIARLLKSL